MGIDWLHGSRYVRLAPGAAEAIAPYLGVAPGAIDELVLDLATWPQAIRPAPLLALDGRLVAGDPVLLDANDEGLLFARRGFATNTHDGVRVSWSEVRDLQILGCAGLSR